MTDASCLLYAMYPAKLKSQYLLLLVVINTLMKYRVGVGWVQDSYSRLKCP